MGFPCHWQWLLIPLLGSDLWASWPLLAGIPLHLLSSQWPSTVFNLSAMSLLIVSVLSPPHWLSSTSPNAILLLIDNAAGAATACYNVFYHQPLIMFHYLWLCCYFLSWPIKDADHFRNCVIATLMSIPPEPCRSHYHHFFLPFTRSAYCIKDGHQKEARRNN